MVPVFPEAAGWAIIFLPLASFFLISFVIRPFFPRYARVSGYLTIAAIAGALGLSSWALADLVFREAHNIPMPSHLWLSIGGMEIRMGLFIDSLTGIMLIVVSLVSMLIQIYSQGYMHGDPGYSRYFAFMSLFTASMLTLVLAGNIILIYMAWELVGLCSYLLIGFWFQRPAAAAAAKKAFIVTRFGDFGLLIAVIGIFVTLGNFDLGYILSDEGLTRLAGMSLVGVSLATWIALGVFAGAMGKSAQFPLHVWLPDAMEGPTPVSALIHAATMVAAGVFLVARFFPLFSSPAASGAMQTVAYIGGFTAVFAASMGLVMTDIKRVLAYSTISQLGYMMMGLGVAGMGRAWIGVGLFHLFNHAFFKALLFMGSGSVNHATGTFDMRQMGGLRRIMPWTAATFLVASLSLAGIPPFSGFWSKDEILAQAWKESGVLFALGLGGAFMTAFYIFRAYFLTFEGKYQGGAASEHEHGHKPGESPAVMIAPMVVLALFALASGLFSFPWKFLGIPAHWMSQLLGAEEVEAFNSATALASVIVSLLGILTAYSFYVARWVSVENLRRALAPLHNVVSRKYYFDDLYERGVCTNLVYRWVSGFLDWFDRYIVDGVVNTIGWMGRNLGSIFTLAQSGQLQTYALGLSFGILAILAAFLLWGR